MNASNAINVSTTMSVPNTMKAPRTMEAPKWLIAGFWIATGFFCLEMLFTAYYELMILPDAAQAFTRLGFPSHAFRIELSWAKVAGVVALLLPMVPSRLKEWAYAGFAINLVSAMIAHLSISDRPAALVPSATTAVLWTLSYFFWRRLQATRASA
jgi:DoxX-like family